MAIYWYVLNVKPHKERFVYEQLLAPEGIPALMTESGALAYKIFFPAVRVKPVNPRSAKIRPYFPGYIFIQADFDSLGLNAFNWIPGTRGIVNFGGEPAVVPDQLIRELKERVNRIEAAGGLVEETFQPGDPIRIVSGPFAGYEGIFDANLPGRERVQILLAFLSEHPQRIKIDPAEIQKVKKTVK
ncbi:MAG: transcription termination/antitermination NusG family protein [Chloroflexota bacterium]|jgi:transcription antitermination factor NusG